MMTARVLRYSVELVLIIQSLSEKTATYLPEVKHEQKHARTQTKS